jgi:hypothetical protein
MASGLWQCGAFTRTDLIVILSALTVLMAVILAPLTIVRSKARLKMCTCNSNKLAALFCVRGGSRSYAAASRTPATG